jgi:NAD(P)H-dependent flavin oxidoreductase YrpB (nitropropane dioxygenase family)
LIFFIYSTPRRRSHKVYWAGHHFAYFWLILVQGVDIICAQGGEGGGHTGDTPFSILIPATVDICKGKKSPLTGEDVIVVAAGGIGDGRGLAASLA